MQSYGPRIPIEVLARLFERMDTPEEVPWAGLHGRLRGQSVCPVSRALPSEPDGLSSPLLLWSSMGPVMGQPDSGPEVYSDYCVYRVA